MIRISIVGSRKIGRIHAQALLKLEISKFIEIIENYSLVSAKDTLRSFILADRISF